MADVVVVPHVDDPIVATPHVDETPTYVPHTTVVPNTSTMVHTAPVVVENNGTGQIPIWCFTAMMLVIPLAIVGAMYLLDRD